MGAGCNLGFPPQFHPEMPSLGGFLYLQTRQPLTSTAGRDHLFWSRMGVTIARNTVLRCPKYLNPACQQLNELLVVTDQREL